MRLYLIYSHFGKSFVFLSFCSASPKADLIIYEKGWQGGTGEAQSIKIYERKMRHLEKQSAL
jgi:hypothetical protein